MLLDIFLSDYECYPQCQNFGQCRQGQCICSAPFIGEYCQYERESVLSFQIWYLRFIYGFKEVYSELTLFNFFSKMIKVIWKFTQLPVYFVFSYLYSVTDCDFPCANGGVCLNGECHCSNGFYGDFCQIIGKYSIIRNIIGTLIFINQRKWNVSNTEEHRYVYIVVITS